jgi:hypothetical protein
MYYRFPNYAQSSVKKYMKVLCQNEPVSGKALSEDWVRPVAQLIGVDIEFEALVE